MGGETGVALVTGASRGLGAVIARELASRGWAVAVNYHSDARSAEQVVHDIRAAGGTAAALPADVTDEAQVTGLVEQVGRRLGPVDVLVINATGPQPGTSAYVAAKGAQVALTHTWARELGPYGITVNLVAPGWIPVERHAAIGEPDRRGYVAEVPLGRLGNPADVAAAVAFLASAAAGFITGERITVNGGHTIGRPLRHAGGARRGAAAIRVRALTEEVRWAGNTPTR